MDEPFLASLAARYALADCPEWRGLVRLLEYASGFAFVPIIVPDAAGAEVCRRELEKNLAAEGKSLLSLPLLPGEKEDLPLQPLLDLSVLADVGVLWVTPDPDLWADDAYYDPGRTARFEDSLWPRFCTHANQARDVIRQRVKVPLILVGTEILRQNLRPHAPDLWSIRDAVIHPEPRQDTRAFTSLVASGELPLEIPNLPPATGDLAETLREIQRLEKDRPESPSLPILLKRAANLEREMFLFEDARAHLIHCLAFYQKNGGDPVEVWDAERILALVLFHSDKAKEAEMHALKALEIAKQSFSGDIWRRGASYELASRVYEKQGKFHEAEEHARAGVECQREVSDSFRLNLSGSLTRWGHTLEFCGKMDQAESAYREAVEIAEQYPFEDKSFLAGPLQHLAEFLESRGNLSEAEQLFRRSLDLKNDSSQPTYRSVAWEAFALAGVLQKQGRYLEAEQLCNRGVEILRTALGENHPNFAMGLENLAVCLRHMDRLEESEKLSRRSLEIIETNYGGNHTFTGHGLRFLSHTLRRQGRLQEAAEMLGEALRIFLWQRDHNHTVYASIGDSIQDYKSILKEMNQSEEQIAENLALIHEQAAAVI